MSDDAAQPSEASSPAEADSVEPEKKSRAGRNLPVAIGVGVLLVALIVGTLIWAPWAFVVLAAAAVWLGVAEVSRAAQVRNIRVAREPILVAVPIVAYVAYNFGPEGHLVVFAALVLVIMLFRLAFGVEEYVRDTAASVFVAAYLPLMLGFAILTLATPDPAGGPSNYGSWLIVTFVALTIGSDIGGYIAGVLFGKHPMSPTISPKKSWEGFAGSLLLQGIIGVLMFSLVLDAPAWQGLVVGLIMTATATLGDFVESAIKRDLGVKDMSDLIPGHGGIMDRLDSLIPNAFVSWALFTWFLGI